MALGRHQKSLSVVQILSLSYQLRLGAPPQITITSFDCDGRFIHSQIRYPAG
ncbi:hypothetical protein CHELA20_51062 [Hyphomicrobiales bacterium]|nr:hypothetical protein CHELA20_51062 [Hyphomicrobiales bacterium]